MSNAIVPERFNAPDGAFRIVTWKLKADQAGEPDGDVAMFKKTMVQVTGDLAGAKVSIKGRIIPDEFDLLSDYDNTPLYFEYRGIKSSEDRFLEIKPIVEGGNARTDIKVAILMCR